MMDMILAIIAIELAVSLWEEKKVGFRSDVHVYIFHDCRVFMKVGFNPVLGI
jgi:hypothetical protein